MDPISFYFFGRPIYWYGVLAALGFMLAVANWSVIGRKEGRPPGFASELGFWVMLAGIIGARVAYVISDFGYYLNNPVEIIRFDRGGLIYYGGFIGGAIGMMLFAYRRKLSILGTGDFTLTGVVLGHAVGRVGCFLNGCCFGVPWDGWAAVSFPPESAASIRQFQEGLLDYPTSHSLHVHATQLYESGLNLLIYAALLTLYFRKKKDGAVVAAYFILYPLARFLIEFLRGDERLQWLGFNVAQELSLLFFIIGCGLWGYLHLRRTGPEATTASG